jgi:predicted glycoside hydrolase/deacetylase ChbG (UPF0249 family)
MELSRDPIVMKSIILCADDYGQNPAISQAIIDLISKNRLSATSCMTNSEYWLSQAKWLESYKNQTDIGLHINLTEGKPLSSRFNKIYGPKMPSLSKLLVKAYFRRLDKLAITDEVNAQLDQFIMGMNQLPTFLDGHQHVHQFPIIRDVMLEIYEKRLRKHFTYIRSTFDSHVGFRYRENAYIKKLIIQLTGAGTLRSQLIGKKIPHNSSFSGIYHFANRENFSEKFTQFLREVGNNGLIMCHPGLQLSGDADSIYLSRPYEYEYFSGEQFLEDCIKEKAQITRFQF